MRLAGVDRHRALRRHQPKRTVRQDAVRAAGQQPSPLLQLNLSPTQRIALRQTRQQRRDRWRAGTGRRCELWSPSHIARLRFRRGARPGSRALFLERFVHAPLGCNPFRKQVAHA